jgi:hypothetical protein
VDVWEYSPVGLRFPRRAFDTFGDLECLAATRFNGCSTLEAAIGVTGEKRNSEKRINIAGISARIMMRRK